MVDLLSLLIFILVFGLPGVLVGVLVAVVVSLLFNPLVYLPLAFAGLVWFLYAIATPLQVIRVVVILLLFALVTVYQKPIDAFFKRPQP